jgi:hypothetical protein
VKIYQELGDRIDRAYERANRDEQAFPRIAAEALREARIPERSSADEVLAWVLGASALPGQDDLAEAFGEPPVTVYRGRDFRVEVLFWLRTVTSVHRHGFSGAFQALAGERLQTRHAFDVKERVNAHFFLGDVRLVGAEVLRPGDVVEITNDLAHALVHLADPSATIVVRTASDPCAGPQLDYRAPFLATDPFHVDELRARKLQALRLLFRVGRDEAVARAAELARLDVGTCLGALDQAYRALGTERRIAEVIAAAIERHGAARTEALMAVLREERRLRAVQALRGQTKDADQRFFLALLHHLPAQADVLPLVKARFPGADPLERVLALAASLTGVRRIGVDFGDAPSRALVGAMLREGSPAGVRKRLAETFDAADVEAQAEAIEGHAERIRGTVLAPLFRGLPGAAKGRAR